jgi:hypothetical protein
MERPLGRPQVTLDGHHASLAIVAQNPCCGHKRNDTVFEYLDLLVCTLTRLNGRASFNRNAITHLSIEVCHRQKAKSKNLKGRRLEAPSPNNTLYGKTQ